MRRDLSGADVRLAALLILALCACKTSSEAKSEVHADLDLQGQLSGIEAVAEHKAQGPSLILEFAPIAASDRALAPLSAPHRTTPATSPAGSQVVAATVPDGLPPHGDLLKATFVGGSTDDIERLARIEAAARFKAEADARAEASKKSAPAGIFGGLASLWPLALLALLGGAAWIGWGLLKKRLP